MELMRETLLSTVSRLALLVGFESTSLEAIELLVDLLYRYLETVSATIANLSSGDSYTFFDGIAALCLHEESISDLLEFAREVGPFFPKPPKVCIPLQGRIQLNPPPAIASTDDVPQPAQNEGQENELSSGSSTAKKDGFCRSLPISIPRPSGLNHPPWANRSKYKLTCVSYDSNTSSIVLHTPPPTITPLSVSNKAISSAKRRSSRSTASTFRRPVVSPPVSISEQNTSCSPKRSRIEEETCVSDVATVVSPLSASPPKQDATVSTDAISSSPVLKVSANAPPKRSLSNNRRLPIRKKNLASRRKRPLLVSKPFLPPQPPASKQVNLSPTVLIEKVDFSVTNILPQRSPSITDAPISCSALDKTPVIGKEESLTVNTDEAGSRVSTTHTASSIDHQSPLPLHIRQITPIQERLSISSDSLFHDSPSRSPFGMASPIVKVESMPKSATISSPHVDPPRTGGSLEISAPSVASNHASLSPATPIASDSDTRPMVYEEECRLYEMERFSKFSTNRRSNSTCSTVASSSSISPSHSTTSSSRLSFARDRSARSKPNLSPVPQPPMLPLIHPAVSLSSSSRASSLPGSMAYQVANQAAISTANMPQAAPHSTCGGGLKLKIRKVGDTMSIQSSERAFTNTITSPSCSGSTDASSSSSNNTTPLSSHHASDAETAARRHAAIPPSFITNKIKAGSPKTFFGSTQPAKLDPMNDPLLHPKAPKIRIKWDAHGKASTSFVSAEDSQPPPRPNITHERLRGSSISNEGSSSSSSHSQSSYDEEETRSSPPLPPQLPMFIPGIQLPNFFNRPVQPPTLPPLTDIPSRRTSSSASGQPPPQLKPLLIDPPPLPKIDPLPTPLSSIQPPSNQSRSKRKTTKRKYAPSPPVLPILDLIDPPTNESGTGGSRKRIFPEIYSDDSVDEGVANAVIAQSKKQSGEQTKRKRIEEPTEGRQMLASGGSSYYTNSKGEKIWLCPLCGTSGGDMVGCDSCDDWYHFQCLGLTCAPETEKWFCPVCVKTLETVKKSSSSSSKRHSGKRYTGSRHSRR